MSKLNISAVEWIHFIIFAYYVRITRNWRNKKCNLLHGSYFVHPGGAVHILYYTISVKCIVARYYNINNNCTVVRRKSCDGQYFKTVWFTYSEIRQSGLKSTLFINETSKFSHLKPLRSSLLAAAAPGLYEYYNIIYMYAMCVDPQH